MMSNSAENLPFVLEWLNIAAHESLEFGKFVAKYSLMHVFNTTVGSAVGLVVGGWLVHKGIFKEKHAIIGETMYVPSGEINPANGEEYVDQDLITKADDFTFQTAFRGKVARQLARKAKDASKLGTLDQPITFTHLEEVIREEDLPKFKKIIFNQWKSHFSARLTPDEEAHCHKVQGRDYLEKKTLFVIPVYEKSEEGNPYKVLYIPMSYLEQGGLPKPENVRVKVGLKENGEPDFQHVPGHPLNERLRTLMKIRDLVPTNPDEKKQWLEDYGVQVPTGRVLTRAEPKLLVA